MWLSGCVPISNDGLDTGSPGIDTGGQGTADTGQTVIDTAEPPEGTTMTGRFSIDAVATATWTGATNDRLEMVDVAGDIDGDGFGDLLLAAPRANSGALTEAGMVFIAYGSPSMSGDTDAHTLPLFAGDDALDLFGQYGTASGVGDLDGDGLGDVMVGARANDTSDGYLATDVGLVGLLYGSSARASGAMGIGSFDATFIPTSPESYAQMGAGLAGLGDVDGDGLDDASFMRYGNGDANTLYLLFGDSQRLTGPSSYAPLPQVTAALGESMGDQQGITGLDIDGDGLSDMLIGGQRGAVATVAALYGDPVRPSVVALSSLPMMTDSEPIQTNGPMTSEFGKLLRSVGDLDGDGYPDVLVADHNHTSLGGPASGQVWLLGGGAVRWSGTEDITTSAFAIIEGVSSGMQCGWAASGLGDFSGDGLDDLVVGAVGWGEPYTSSGAAGIFRGPLSGSLSFGGADVLFEGSAGSTSLGSGLAAADVDGDGGVDLAVAAMEGSGYRGRVYLVRGGSL